MAATIAHRPVAEFSAIHAWPAQALRDSFPSMKPTLARIGILLLALATLGKADASGDFLNKLANRPGLVHEDPHQPFLQELSFNGRVHWQYARVFGNTETAGGTRDSFDYGNRGEMRRIYFGPTIRFLDVFRLKAEANWVLDEKYRGGDRDFGYQSLFEAYLAVDLKRLLDLERVDGLTLSYGLLEMKFTEEHMTSSKDLMTVERSMLDAWLLPGVPVPANPTGVWLEWKQGPDKFSGGIFSTSHSREFARWEDGTGHWLTWQRDLTASIDLELAEMAVNFMWNNSEATDEQAMNYDWAATAWGRFGEDRWGLRGTFILGENRLPGIRGGTFGGIDLLATWWLEPKRWQLAVRSEIAAASESEGLRLANRYTRVAGEPDNENLPALANGRGDRHLSLYTGLTWFIHHPNLRLMAGVEWERMERGDLEQTVYDGTTCWFAARMFF